MTTTIKDRIIEHIAANPEATAEEISETLGEKLSTVRSYLSTLRSGGRREALTPQGFLRARIAEIEAEIAEVEVKRTELAKLQQALAVLEA